MAEAKSIMIKGCKNEPQQLVCTRSVEAAFADRALDKTFDAKRRQVLQDVFRLGLLSQYLSLKARMSEVGGAEIRLTLQVSPSMATAT